MCAKKYSGKKGTVLNLATRNDDFFCKVKNAVEKWKEKATIKIPHAWFERTFGATQIRLRKPQGTECEEKREAKHRYGTSQFAKKEWGVKNPPHNCFCASFPFFASLSLQKFNGNRPKNLANFCLYFEKDLNLKSMYLLYKHSTLSYCFIEFCCTIGCKFFPP